MAIKIFPSTNDVYGAGSIGDGNILAESSLATLFAALARSQNYVLSGLTVSATYPDLEIDVASGVTLIEGYRVTSSAPLSATLAANDTNYIYLQLTRDGSNNVTGAQLVANVTGSTPTDSVLICKAVTDATAITSTHHVGERAGNWTPEVSDSESAVTAGGQTYTTQNGEYIKEGNLVHLTCELTMSSIGTLAGDVYIHGLPFPPAVGPTGTGAVYALNWSITAGQSALALINSFGEDVAQIWLNDTANGCSRLQFSELTNTGHVTFSCSYRTN